MPYQPVTCWQVLVGEEWRFFDSSDAARLARLCPNRIRLGELTPVRPRFERWNKPAARPVTPQRLAAAARAIEASKERAGLFAATVPSVTPEERVAHFDQGSIDAERDRRKLEAQSRMKAWRIFRSLPLDAQHRVALNFCHWGGPRNAFSLLYLIRKDSATS